MPYYNNSNRGYYRPGPGPGNPIVGYGPSSQPDVSSAARVRSGAASNTIPFDDVIKALNAANLPPQLRQVFYVTRITAVGTPALLLPANPNRMSFLIAAPLQTSILFSYNFPFKGLGDSGGNNIFMGVPIPSNSFFQEGNGTVSVDDIFVWSNTVVTNYPFDVIAFEGTLAVESHLKQQTAGGNVIST